MRMCPCVQLNLISMPLYSSALVVQIMNNLGSGYKKDLTGKGVKESVIAPPDCNMSEWE